MPVSVPLQLIAITLPASAALALQDALPATPLDQSCGFLVERPATAGAEVGKGAQLLAMGYVQGYVEASAAACAGAGAGAPFCRRSRAGRIGPDALSADGVRAAVMRFCLRSPRRTLREAVNQFMREQGVLDPVPAAGRR